MLGYVKRCAFVLCIALLVGACAPPRPVKIYHLPLLSGNGYSWPKHGLCVSADSDAPSLDALRAAHFWYHDWTPRCADTMQVPMHWGGYTFPQLWQCNDGRPLLVFNEPERNDQANLAPGEAARILRDLSLRWHGELYCCGTLARSLAWQDEMLSVYEKLWGRMPIAGWHIHVYRWPTDGDYGQAQFVADAVREVQEFARHYAQKGYPLPIVVSEYGTLAANAQPSDLINVMDSYEILFTVDNVVSIAWFASYHRVIKGNSLLNPDGSLTALGRHWLSFVR